MLNNSLKNDPQILQKLKLTTNLAILMLWVHVGSTLRYQLSNDFCFYSTRKKDTKSQNM